ncbi:hypothetical protein CRENBAI_021849 [Crenichthys baileyi]|uniref:Uncharacterized protein n=1 Tax=Crenichthys baileyi TaxID=28760 RepID=A0AAV9RI87_9TELE
MMVTLLRPDWTRVLFTSTPISFFMTCVVVFRLERHWENSCVAVECVALTVRETTEADLGLPESSSGSHQKLTIRIECFITPKNMTLTPQESRNSQAGPLHKKKPPKLPNGLTLESCKYNHHQHQSSDQENNPSLAHTQGKRKKKHLNKKRRMVS